jgi:hypothetical protein
VTEQVEAEPAPQGDLAVQIMDMSGANGSDPVETVTGFEDIEHANAFARRYVRDSVERCRAPGMDGKSVLDAWFAFGEDAEVLGAGDDGWVSRSELKDFAESPVRDTEDRNWRALDPRRDEDDDADEDEA